jgi:predicted Zn-dependent peptidase
VAIPPAAPAAVPGKIYLVDRPDAAQTVVAQLLPCIARTSPDFYAISLVDSAWGGAAGARLNMNLREDKGYAYGAFSNLNAMTKAGAWTANAGVQTDKTAESITEFDKELKGLVAGRPIEAEEFTATQARQTRGYTQQFESLARVTQQMGNLWVLGLPMTELQKEFDATGALTLADIQAAVKKYVQPGKASLLLVGDRAKIEAKVKALNLGEIVLLDVEGKPVTATGTK